MAETQRQFKLLGWIYAFAWLMDLAAGRSVWECTDRLRAVHNKPSLPKPGLGF
jgi:hypothetical protein